MARKDKSILIRLTEAERSTLKQKASKADLSVSEYVRLALIYSKDATIRVIDTSPLRDALWELKKQGVNLNQLMKSLNTYGPGGFDSKEVKRILEMEAAVFWGVLESLASLREAAENEGINITYSEGEAQ